VNETDSADERDALLLGGQSSRIRGNAQNRQYMDRTNGCEWKPVVSIGCGRNPTSGKTGQEWGTATRICAATIKK